MSSLTILQKRMEIVKNTSKEVRVQGQMVQILIDHAMNVHESCMKLCLDKMNEFECNTVDITGGAPEMNSDFRWFVEEIRKTNVR